jgi:hypothetical protein
LVSTLQRRDYLGELLDNSRWLSAQESASRTAWYNQLPVQDKSSELFELEMMLKAIVCLGNPMNHPGPPRRDEIASGRNFAAVATAAAEIAARVVEVGRRLSLGREEEKGFLRYLESVIAQDHVRYQMGRSSLAQDRPESSLPVLVSTFDSLKDVLSGLSELPHLSYLHLTSALKLAQREIHRSVFFDPLAVLEFRREFDQLRSTGVAAAVTKSMNEPGRRVGTLAVLSLMRLLKYVECVEQASREKAPRGVILGWFAVLRSDARALRLFLKRDTAAWISDGFGKEFEHLSPLTIGVQFDELAEEFSKLRRLKSLVGSLGDQLGLEVRKTFELQLPRIDDDVSQEQLTEAVGPAVAGLKVFLQTIAVLLASEFDPEVEASNLFSDYVPLADRAERLRRDIWMFQQVLRAFVEKAEGTRGMGDHWSSANTFGFVKELVRYFRAMGYPLLRYSDYAGFDEFMNLVDRLREGDVLEVLRLSKVVEACRAFSTQLDQTFEAISRREELVGVPFDRKEAVRTLKLLLKR